MKKANTLLLILAFLITLVLPFALPSGAMLEEPRSRMTEELWAQEEQDEGSFLLWLLPQASAEGSFEPLPIDFTPGHPLSPDRFSEDGYFDDSIELRLETLEMDSVICKVAYIAISDPSQLRTVTAGKPSSSRVALISSMAEKNNAVIAINANYLSNDPVKTSFEYRMGQKVRNKLNRTKDLLIIDENADFNLFIKSDKDEVQAFEDAGHQIINAFTFGPALVKDGELLTLDDNYGYNPNGREPRLAIGQIAPLNYIIVLAEGRSKDSQGLTHEELANIMFDLGSMQAFNLDGGNSATMVFNGGYYQNKTRSNERAQSDMIYFASLIND